MYGFIYITTNLINGRQYIGQHKGDGEDNYLGSGSLLKLAINKYGKENFKREVLEFAFTKEELDELERYYIALAQATTDSKFYNIHEGGNGGNTMVGWSEADKEDFKKKMSEVTSGELNGMYGRNHSEETRNKISETRRINLQDESHYLHSQEFRNKMKEVTMGEKNGNYGNKGDKAKNGKTVFQWKDKEHTILVNRFNTVRLALEYLNLKGHTKLMEAIKNNTLYKGYYWSK